MGGTINNHRILNFKNISHCNCISRGGGNNDTGYPINVGKDIPVEGVLILL